jgi:hypothetical protein
MLDDDTFSVDQEQCWEDRNAAQALVCLLRLMDNREGDFPLGNVTLTDSIIIGKAREPVGIRAHNLQAVGGTSSHAQVPVDHRVPPFIFEVVSFPSASSNQRQWNVREYFMYWLR